MMGKFKLDNGRLLKLMNNNYEGTAGDVVGKAKGYSIWTQHLNLNMYY